MSRNIEARQRGNGNLALSLLAGTVLYGALCVEATRLYSSVPHPDRYHPGYCLRGDNFTKGPVRKSVPDRDLRRGLRIVGGLSNGTGIRLSPEGDGVVVSSEGPPVELTKPGSQESRQLRPYSSTKVPLGTAISFDNGGHYNVRLTSGDDPGVSGIRRADTYIREEGEYGLKIVPEEIDPNMPQAIVTFSCSDK